MQQIVTIHIEGDSIDAVNNEFLQQCHRLTESLALVSVQMLPLVKPDKTIRMDGAPAMRMEWHLIAYLQKKDSTEQISDGLLISMGIDPDVMRFQNLQKQKEIQEYACSHEDTVVTYDGKMKCTACGKILQ